MTIIGFRVFNRYLTDAEMQAIVEDPLAPIDGQVDCGGILSPDESIEVVLDAMYQKRQEAPKGLP